jgi:hypothetical protein
VEDYASSSVLSLQQMFHKEQTVLIACLADVLVSKRQRCVLQVMQVMHKDREVALARHDAPPHKPHPLCNLIYAQ